MEDLSPLAGGDASIDMRETRELRVIGAEPDMQLILRFARPDPKPSHPPSQQRFKERSWLEPEGQVPAYCLEDQLVELRRTYETSTIRIRALDTDISREMDSMRKQVLIERRMEMDTERVKVAQDMDRLEKKLTR